MRYVLIGCQALFVAVFVWSAASKLRSRSVFGEFANSLRPLVAAPGLVAAAVVAAEAAIPPLLLVAPVWGFAAATALLGVLTAGVGLVVRRGTVLACRCFGPASQPLGVRHLVRNLALLTLAAAGLLVAVVATQTQAELAGGVLAVGGALVVATLFIRFDDIAELFA